MHPSYARDSLAVTSQFYYCGLPLRLDSYSRCQFNCAYCFANARGGNRGTRKLSTANPISIQNRFERLQGNQPNSVIDEFLLNKQPIHFGGMSDPFIPVEKEMGISLRILEILAEYQYPTVISTKSNLFSEDKYLNIIKKGKFIIQASISSMNNKLLEQVDLGTPGPKALIKALAIASAEGISTACRIQPLLPTRERDAYDVIDACASIGVKHVAVEHLKLPIERNWSGTERLSKALDMDLWKYFESRRARRIGRELLLPPEERFERMLRLREYTHSKSMSFGAADNDFLLFSDGSCCCSGIDLIEGFNSSFKYNYTEAIRRGMQSKKISMKSISGIWRPTKSIGQYINSHSRISDNSQEGASIDKYIRKNWNGNTSGNSPLALHGVIDTGEFDEEGFKIFTFKDDTFSLIIQK